MIVLRRYGNAAGTTNRKMSQGTEHSHERTCGSPRAMTWGSLLEKRSPGEWREEREENVQKREEKEEERR